MNFQPIQTSGSKRFSLGKNKEGSGEIVAHVVEVRGQGVDASPEVDVVREEDDVLPERVCDRETVECVAPEGKTFLEKCFNKFVFFWY